MQVEAGSKGPVDSMEASMTALVTIKQVRNLFADNPRFPEEG